MRLIVCLFIFFFSQISSSQEIVKDSVRINEKKNINYEEEIKKFRDSISEKNYPIILFKEYSKLDSNLIIDNTDNLDKLYKLSTSNTVTLKNNYSNIITSGSISRGVAKGLALSPNIAGSRTANPTTQAIVPKITTGKIYSKSFGQAGSP